jgi:hypothetical protein
VATGGAGEQDGFVHPVPVEEFTSRLRESRLEGIAGAGHPRQFAAVRSAATPYLAAKEH